MPAVQTKTKSAKQKKAAPSQAGFTDLLKAELARRCNANPLYSLRSFAAALGISPSFLSKLLLGQRPVTLATLTKISARLALDPAQVESFRQQLDPNSSPEPSFRSIELDQFQLIADWYHFAILELLTLKDFKDDPKWIAASLGIGTHQVRDALERLSRLGYITKNKGHFVLLKEHNSTIGPELAVPATRTQQTQFLGLAQKALEEIPIQQRSQTSMTMAIPEKRLGEARELIQEFRRRFTSLLQRPGERDAVFQLNISFFPLTETPNNPRRIQ